MLVERITYEGPVRKRVTKFSHGGHIIVPGHWVGKEVRVTIIDDDQQQVAEETIKSKEDLKSEYAKFKRHVRGAARLAKKNVNFSESADSNK